LAFVVKIFIFLAFRLLSPNSFLARRKFAAIELSSALFYFWFFALLCLASRRLEKFIGA